MQPNPSILVVDDDEDDCEFLREACQASHYPCALNFASDGQQALDLLAQGQRLPDVILLDINMPLMDGFELLRTIRESPHLSAVPVVMLTTSSSQQSVNKAYRLGANSYLVKPPNFQVLVQIWEQFYGFWIAHARLPTSPYQGK